MERSPAHPRILRATPITWIRTALAVVAVGFALGAVPALGASASAAVAPHGQAHLQAYGSMSPPPGKPAGTKTADAKAVHKGPAVGRAQVKISNFKFGPRTLTVHVGTRVTWTNRDAIAHSVNFTNGNVNSKTLGNGATFSRTFTAPGTYAYICAIHPFMHGTVVVTA